MAIPVSVPLGLLLVLGLAACASEDPEPRLGAEGHLAVAGAQLWYASQGSGAPVLILHGGPGIGSGYFLSAFSAPGFPPEGMRWIAYDQRGSGRSTGAESPDSLTVERFVADLEAVRRATGEERVALMGHSWGGLLALHYAVAHPDRVAAMILLDPDPASRALWARYDSIVSSRRTEDDFVLMDAIASQEGWELDPELVEHYQVVRMRSYFGRVEAAEGLRLGLEQAVYGNFPGTAVRVRESLGEWNLFDRLPQVPARTLILTGDASIFPPEAHVRLAEALPNAELVVLPGVGHFPHMEDPAGFAAAVNAFLESVTRDAGGA